jgi:endo-1,4-beta-xylanase
MPTRRKILMQTLQAGAAWAISRSGGVLVASAQQSAQTSNKAPASAADEMTVNSAPHPQALSHYDFGPIPTELPREAKAVGGPRSLKKHAQNHGLIAGAAIQVRALQSDPALQELVAEQYAILVPEGELKWRALRPAEDRFDFAASDALFDFAAKHRMLVRGHTLVWGNSLPDWLQGSAGKRDAGQLLVDHIRTVAGRYRGRVHSWDVVNEAIEPKDGQLNGLRKSFWYDAIGPAYIELAFRAAREADPHAKLTYNDYAVEYDSEEDAERRTLILALLRRLRERNIPLDAVGIQAHINAGSPYTVGKGLADYIESVRAIGLEVYLTEMDVYDDDLPDDVQRRDYVVAETYRQFLDVALANPAIKLILTWGVSDRRTWLNDPPRDHRKHLNRPQRSLPFDSGYRPVRAFFAIRGSFESRKI